jgi:hypothetical protein
MEAHLVVLLDLASLAAQHRPGYSTALGAAMSTIRDALRSGGGLVGEAADEVVARALYESIRRITPHAVDDLHSVCEDGTHVQLP